MAQMIAFNPLTTDLTKVKFTQKQLDNIYGRYDYLKHEIPRRLEQRKKLKEIRAPKSVMQTDKIALKRLIKEFEGLKALVNEYNRRCKAFFTMLFTSTEEA